MRGSHRILGLFSSAVLLTLSASCAITPSDAASNAAPTRVLVDRQAVDIDPASTDLEADAKDAAAACGSEYVPWEEVRAQIGQRVKIQGFVAGVGSDPDTGTRFLNLGNDYPDPDRLTIVAFPDASGQARGFVDDARVSRSVCVEGELVSYEGVLQIHLG